jgi:tyrosyl-tRNA synthetase
MSGSRKLPADLHEHVAAFRRAAIWTDEPMEMELIRKLERAVHEGRGLRLKFGMDPSSPDLHVGHAVILLKLRDLQQLGHTIVLIVGDATAMVGDPSGRNKLRPQLSREEVNRNLVTYTEQAGILLDMSKTEVRRNSEWFDAMRFEDLLKLLGRRTVAQTLAREDFQKRLAEDAPIGLHELVYPVMQGWDSVQVRADVEFGGTDQLFNLLVGRDLQAQCGQEPQVVLMSPLILGTDGRKMSKSYGNTIGLTNSPEEVFGKTMRIDDTVLATWFENLTRIPTEESQALIARNPREAKARLAWELVFMLHGNDAAHGAQAEFDRVHVHKELPSEIPESAWPWPGQIAATVNLPLLMKAVGLVSSTSEARRLIEQGGVRLNGVVVKEPLELVSAKQANLIRVGKRRVRRVLPDPKLASS